MFNSNFLISQDTFILLFEGGMIVDGRCGGIIIGAGNDGIFTIQETEPKKYRIPAKFEGGEYLINHNSTQKYKGILEEINNDNDGRERLKATTLSNSTRVINTHATPDNKFLLIDSLGNFIVNSSSTAKYINELELINDDCNPYLECDLSLLKPRLGL